MKCTKKLIAGIISVSFCMSSVLMPIEEGSFKLFEDISITASAESTLADDFLSTAIDKSGCTIYNSSLNTESFNMAGRTYYQGITFDKNYGDGNVSFNVEDINNISFTFGHVDGSKLNTGILEVYLDGTLSEKFPLSYNNPLEECELDVSGASLIKFVIDSSSSSFYALGDIKVDSIAPSMEHTVPTYSSSEELVSSIYDTVGTVYSSNLSTSCFNMSGRTYYQGVVFNKNYGDGAVSFNVENANEMAFTVGHVDNSNGYDGVIEVYLDNVLSEKIEVRRSKPLQECVLDVKDVSNVRVILDSSSSSYYALADITIDKMSPKTKYDVPTYSTSEDLISKYYDAKGSYYTSDKFESFNIAGRTYYQGFVFNKDYGDGTLSFNVENVNEMSFTLGHLDNSYRYDAILEVYLDDVLTEKINLWANKPLQEHTIDLKNASNIRFVLDGTSSSYYALANITIDTILPKMDCNIPVYEKPEDLISKYYDSVGEFYTSDKFTTFKMNGRTYYQGVVFNKNYGDGNTSFNVENANEMTFKIGHVDNSRLYDATLYIYLDDVLVEEKIIKANNPVQEYTLDVSESSNVRFVLDSSSGSYYALADITLDGVTPAIESVMPVYETADDLILNSFNPSGAKTYKSNDQFEYFSMAGKTYYQGVTFIGTYGDGDISFNVEDVKGLAFTLGHVDNSGTKSGTLDVYLDGVLYKKIELEADKPVKEYIFNVSNASTIRFVLNTPAYSSSYYALADLQLTDAPKALLGDVNDDNSIDSYDASLILAEYARVSSNQSPTFSEEQMQSADVNGDGIIDSFDASLILSYYAYQSSSGNKSFEEFLANN